MDVRKSLGWLALALLSIVAFLSSPVEACSCMLSHPQTHFCTADYVIMIRVKRKSQQLVTQKTAYKVEIKRSYKMNEEAHKMLQHGRILTPASDGVCGVELKVGGLYMIAGNTPQLNLCNYVKEYKKMTVVERRGFTGAYRKGCKCEIKPCYNSRRCESMPESHYACKWSPFAKCETDYSACMPSHYRTPEGVIAKCRWRKTQAYKECMLDP